MNVVKLYIYIRLESAWLRQLQRPRDGVTAEDYSLRQVAASTHFYEDYFFLYGQGFMVEDSCETPRGLS